MFCSVYIISYHRAVQLDLVYSSIFIMFSPYLATSLGGVRSLERGPIL